MKLRYQNSIAILIAVIVTNSLSLCAQDKDIKADKNKDKVTIEDIKPVCPDLAQDKKPRLTVANFKLTAPNAPKDQFGDNLATMLTNALQNVQCYRVLERLANMSDVQDELNYQQNSGNTSSKSKVAKGKMLGANVIVQGEVTEFEQSSGAVGVTLLHKNSYHSKVGIIIRMVDPETREDIVIKSFNVEKKTGGGLSVGLGAPGSFGSISAMSTVFSNPAVQDAVEDCIIQAAEYIASMKDKVSMPANSVPDGASQYTLTFNNIDYNTLNAVTAALQKTQGVSDVNSDDFSDNVANVVVTQTTKLKQTIDALMASGVASKLSVSGMSKDGASFKVK